jgi:adenine-specific DNA-methyltransferase
MGRYQGRLELTWTNKDRALLSAGEGRYDYEFVDSHDPRVLEVRLLDQVDRVEADGAEDQAAGLPEPTTDNLLITGDSMHALDALAKTPEHAAKYLGKVKLAYIDPPFNTGQAFEHYEDNIEHSIWLTLLRDRIRQIKPLLAPEGSLWVHLDDMEVHRCRAVLDEELGEGAFVATIVWQKRYSRDNRPAIGAVHDYILVYAPQGPSRWKQIRNRVPRTNASQYRNPNNDPNGPWRPVPLDVQGGHATASQFYDVTTPSGRVVRPANGRAWSVTAPVMEALRERGELYFGLNGDGMPNTIRYLKDDEGLVPWTWWPETEVGNNDESKKEIVALFGENTVFDTPKPERLMERIITIATDPGDLVLDCFAGSGTTAAVSHKMGRRWITVELSDSTAQRFLIPRLTRVVEGTDGVGISARESEGFVDEDLSGVIKTDDAKTLVRALAAVAKTGVVEAVDESQLDKLVKELRRRLKPVRTPASVVAGGGFTHLAVGSSMYEVDDDGDVFLSGQATNGAWSKSVAAQLKFTLTPDHPVFCGIRGRQRLAVIDGVADEVVVHTVLENLADRERAVIVAKAVLPEAAQLLSEMSPGSRIRRAPEDLFSKRTVK